MWDRHDVTDYKLVARTKDFPWGDQNPPGGFQVGDYVGLVYSDHDEYIFDNPVGFVTALNEEDGYTRVTVEVEASIGSDRVFLMARKKTPEQAGSDAADKALADLGILPLPSPGGDRGTD